LKARFNEDEFCLNDSHERTAAREKSEDWNDGEVEDILKLTIRT